jgi:hypothetical protein
MVLSYFLLEMCWVCHLSLPSYPSYSLRLLHGASFESCRRSYHLFSDEGYFAIPETSSKTDEIHWFEDLRQRHTLIGLGHLKFLRLGILETRANRGP